MTKAIMAKPKKKTARKIRDLKPRKPVGEGRPHPVPVRTRPHTVPQPDAVN